MMDADNFDDLDDEMPEVAEYPLDISKLKKGMTLTATELVACGAINGPWNRNDWAFDLLRLRDWIMARSIENGTPFSVRISRGGLHINTDSEASEYHDKRAHNAQRGIFRQIKAMHNLVDVSQLNDQQQQQHNRSLCNWGAKAAMIKKAERKQKRIESSHGDARHGGA